MCDRASDDTCNIWGHLFDKPRQDALAQEVLQLFAVRSSSKIESKSLSSKEYLTCFLSFSVSLRGHSSLVLLLLFLSPFFSFLMKVAIISPFLITGFLGSFFFYVVWTFGVVFCWAICISTLFTLETNASNVCGSVLTNVTISGMRLLAHICIVDCSDSFSGH